MVNNKGETLIKWWRWRQSHSSPIGRYTVLYDPTLKFVPPNVPPRVFKTPLFDRKNIIYHRDDRALRTPSTQCEERGCSEAGWMSKRTIYARLRGSGTSGQDRPELPYAVKCLLEFSVCGAIWPFLLRDTSANFE